MLRLVRLQERQPPARPAPRPAGHLPHQLERPLGRAQVWGPAPAPVARVRGRHRVRLLVKADKAAPLQPALAAWAAQVRLPGSVRLAIDIDPQSFM
jgi:primosomal protein N' (replication factor Y)